MGTEVKVSKNDLEFIREIKRSLLQDKIDQIKSGRIKVFESIRDQLLKQIATAEVDIIVAEQQLSGINKKNRLTSLKNKVDMMYKELNNHYMSRPISQYNLIERYEEELKNI